MAAAGLGWLIWWGASDRTPAQSAEASAARIPPAVTEPAARSLAATAAAAPAGAPAGDSLPAANPASTEGLDQRVEAVLKLPKPSERRQALEDLAGALARHDRDRGLELLKRLLAERGETSADARAFVSGFAADFAAVEPAAAAVWIDSMPLDLRFEAGAFVAQHWTRADLSAATAWAESISEPSLKATVLRRIGQELERTGEAKVMAAWAQRLAASPEAAQHIEMIGRLWAHGDAPEAFRWSSQLEDTTQRASAVVAVAATTAGLDAQLARTWVEQLPAGESRNQAAIATSAKWAESDPAAAVRWVARFGDRQLLDAAVRSIAGRWLQQDRPGATAWIRAAPLAPATKDYLLGRGKE